MSRALAGRQALSTEVAAAMTEAERAVAIYSTAIFRKPTHANVLVDIAKKLQRLQTRATRQRRELATTLADIKIAKRELRDLTKAIGTGAA